MAAASLTADETRRWSRVGTLAALAMVLGYLETFVPIPLPGVKLGLANIAVLLMLAARDVWGAFWVAVIKVVATGLLFGSPVTLAYSAVGTTLAFAVMVPLSQLRTMRLEMVSVAGALAHQAGQLLVAQALLGTSAVWYGAPVLMVAGCVTGLLSGMVAMRARTLMQEQHDDKNAPLQGVDDIPGEAFVPLGEGPVRIDPRVALALLGVVLVVTLRLSDVAPLALMACACLAACLLLGATTKDVARSLRPAALMCAITCVAQVATVRSGTPLFALGPVVVTTEALTAALASTLRLVAVVLASLAYVGSQGPEGVKSGMRWLLTPLSRLGVRLEGPAYAMDVALGALPVLASGMAGSPATGLGSGGLRGALDALPNLVVRAWRLAEAAPQSLS